MDPNLDLILDVILKIEKDFNHRVRLKFPDENTLIFDDHTIIRISSLEFEIWGTNFKFQSVDEFIKKHPIYEIYRWKYIYGPVFMEKIKNQRRILKRHLLIRVLLILWELFLFWLFG